MVQPKRTPSYLRCRRGRYLVQVRVPDDLRAKLGKRNLETYLGTSSEAEARRKSHAAVADILESFKRIRGGTLSADDVAVAADAEARTLYAEWANDPALVLNPAGDFEIQFTAATARMDLERADPTTPRWGRAEAVVRGLGLEPTPETTKLVLDAMARQTLGAIRAFVQGRELPPPPERVRRRRAGQGATLSDVLASWAREGRRPDKTLHEWTRAVRRWGELHGETAVSDITTEMVAEFKDALLQCPARPPHSLRKLPLPQLIREAPADTPRTSPAAVNKTIGAIRSVLSHAKRNGLLERNAASGVRAIVSDKREDEERRPFEPVELQKVLDAARKQERPADRWLPFLGAFMGAREAEMGLARVADVGTEGKVHFLRITDAGSGRRVKTRTSRRTVPIHPTLIKLGFLDYVASLDANGPLFPGLKVAAYSKRFARMLDSIGLKDPTLVFHSFRHGFKDQCRAAAIEEEVHDALTGHAGGGVGRRYGKEGPPLAIKAGAVAKISYPGLKVSGRLQP